MSIFKKNKHRIDEDLEVLFREWADEEANHLWEYYALEDDSKLTENAKEYCKDMLWYGYLKGKADAEKEVQEMGDK